MANDKKLEAKAYTAKGASRDSVALPGALFDGTVHMPAMHQAVKAFLANQRQGTASTKIRKFVTGGNQKPWKQKGTGRARQGSIRAPHWVGGGTVFGPTPRSYAQYVPRQVRALARKSALNARARENAIFVIEALDFDSPKTKAMTALLEKIGTGERKVLMLTNGMKPNVFLSGRNLPNVHVMPYSDVSTYHVLWSDFVVIEEGALNGEAADQAPDQKADPKAEQKAAKKAASVKSKAKAVSTAKAKAVKKAVKRTAAKSAAKKKGK
ncbi:MAG: 50S ribosomal protein L4 [Gemmatimonadaceae bacterium]